MGIGFFELFCELLQNRYVLWLKKIKGFALNIDNSKFKLEYVKSDTIFLLPLKSNYVPTAKYWKIMPILKFWL